MRPDELVNPQSRYRSAPFWCWNADLRADRLLQQLEGMKRQGIGGFFIHSREGLETPYLSGAWMDLVKYSVKEAKRLQLEAWIYDEDKWPSGSAGGMVGALDREYIAKGLTFALRKRGMETLEAQDAVVGVYPYHENEEIVLCAETSLPSEWYNNLAPTDTLNPEAIRAFLRLTHEKYKETIGGEFGGALKGFFTDEPNCFDFFTHFETPKPWVPWTRGLTSFFTQNRGYNPTPYLPYLFVDDFHPAISNVSREKLRHDFWYTVTERFSQAYMKQLFDWCSGNGLLSAGHLLYENDLGYQVRVCGAVMPHYRYLHAPSVDILGEQIGEYLTVKQCTSVAHQYGRTTTFAEIYGCTGWDLTFEGQRWLSNWLFAMGITRMCQHLALYSITGCRKRDYPPVFNEQTTWWEHDHYLEEYRARIAQCLTQGEVVREVLVIHPISSVWCQCASAADENLSHLEMNMGWTDSQFTSLNLVGEEYNRLSEMLLRLHIDFDFGDEIILQEEAAVTGSKLRVGKAEYSAVVVPRVASLFAGTYALINAFAQNGGVVYWVQPYPQLVEGEVSPEAGRLLHQIRGCENFHTAMDYQALVTLLEADRVNVSAVSVCGSTFREDGGILTMLRRMQDGYMLFLANTDRGQNHEVFLSLQASGCVEEYDPMSNSVKFVSSSQDGDRGLRFAAGIDAAGCKLFYIHTQRTGGGHKAEAHTPYRHLHAAENVLYSLDTVQAFHRTTENILTLDQCRFSLAGEPFSEEMEVWVAQRLMRERLGMPPNHYNGAPQRYRWIHSGQYPEVPFALSFAFAINDLPETAVCAAIEHAGNFQVLCNGVSCEKTQAWLMDRDIIKCRLGGLHKGMQTLTLCGMYSVKTELENIYITGDFGVNEDRVIVRERAALRLGDFRGQGYTHYPGAMVCEFTVPSDALRIKHRCVLLRAGEFHAVLLKVWVNGAEAGILLNGRETLDITKYLNDQDNDIAIEAVGSPRNMLGPFHTRYTGCSRISWEDFRAVGSAYSAQYHTVPFGIEGPIVLLFEA